MPAYRYTIENGRLVKVPNGENLYLGRDVKDVGKKGYDQEIEVINTLREIEKDYEEFKKRFNKPYARLVINGRLMRLALIVSNDTDFNCQQKEKLLKIINKKRKEMGFKPIDIKKYLENFGCKI